MNSQISNFRRGAIATVVALGALVWHSAFGAHVVAASIAVSDVTLIEGNAGSQNAVVNVSLDAPSTKTISVNYSTANGTAKAGSDYDAVSGKLTFAPGEISKTILVPVKGDRLGEVSENFFLKLQGAKNAKINNRFGTAIVIIQDDEPRISISNGVQGSATTLWSFDVSLSRACDEAVTVDYATADGTALAGEQYVATSGTLSFAPSETTKTIMVEFYGGADEYFYVNLSGASANAWFDVVPQGFGGYMPGEPCDPTTGGCSTEGDGGYGGPAP